MKSDIRYVCEIWSKFEQRVCRSLGKMTKARGRKEAFTKHINKIVGIYALLKMEKSI